jgi:hypothetical protein
MMKTKSTFICMLLCMHLAPVWADEISPVKTSNDVAGKMAVIPSGIEAVAYAAWHAPVLEVSDVYPDQIDLVFTDNSYDDVSYSLSRLKEGSETWEWLYDFEAPDSGSVTHLPDGPLTPGTLYSYSISVTLENGNSLADVAMASATTGLEPPIIAYDNMHMYECGSEIPIVIDYPDSAPYTEVYRSNSANGPWELLETLSPGIRNVVFDVSPRQTHFFRARGTNAAHDVFSDWSNVISRHVESDYYAPNFTATVLADGTVDVTLVHNSYVNIVYGISKITVNEDFVVITSQLAMSDSAGVYTFHDTDVEAGKTYVYLLDGYQSPILCVGWPGGGDMDTNLAEVEVTIPPDDYTIAGFTLVDPVTDQDIGPLTNGALFEANLLPNIRANVGPDVKSVIFFLNNKRRTDNGPPLFTYFPAQNDGDYEPGVWLPTTYNLKATAYSEKNGKGIKGTTLEINFQILASVHLDSLVLIDPVTNAPIRRLRNFDTVDASLNANIRAYTSDNAKCVTFFLNNKRRTDNGPPVFTYFALGTGGLSVPGQYLLKSTASTEKNGGGLVGYTFYTNFTVTCSACATPLLAENDTDESTISLYPNPIGNQSRLLISAPVASVINVQVYDQFGTPFGRQIDATVDVSGKYQLPLKELPLNKGAYILSVKIDGVRTVKRFVVE